MSTNPPDTVETLTPAPLSRMEAMEFAIRIAVVVHLIVCVLSVLLLATLLDARGVFWGLGVAAALAFAIPFVVLPVAAAIGFFSHLAFNGTRIAVPVMIRTLVILFEATFFGWLVVMVVVWHG